MRWVGGLWVAALIVLLSGARVQAEEPTGEPVASSSMAADPLSPRAVAAAAESRGGAAPASERFDPDAERERRARNRLAAGAGMGLSGLAHLGIMAASGLYRPCENDEKMLGSMILAGAATVVGAALFAGGVRMLKRAKHKQPDRAPTGEASAVAIGVGTFTGVQAALWGIWFAGVATNGSCYLF